MQLVPGRLTRDLDPTSSHCRRHSISGHQETNGGRRRGGAAAISPGERASVGPVKPFLSGQVCGERMDCPPQNIQLTKEGGKVIPATYKYCYFFIIYTLKAIFWLLKNQFWGGGLLSLKKNTVWPFCEWWGHLGHLSRLPGYNTIRQVPSEGGAVGSQGCDSICGGIHQGTRDKDMVPSWQHPASHDNSQQGE